ncbi:acyl carrier protein [Vannielia sp.]|uniref:acyl carrier protein n=1 Tax=Vannielia sp. TaxID=2813045 RepID=UPI0026092EDA|nr:acyl carrier protein [Vannielia sp.]MDF1871075.1 acyl carrier protein [Vannielia sp.]
MTHEEAEAAIAEELHAIAPEIALEDIDRSGVLREEFDIDSMDFLRLVTALGERFELAMPEADYPQMGSFDALVGYLKQKTA